MLRLIHAYKYFQSSLPLFRPPKDPITLIGHLSLDTASSALTLILFMLLVRRPNLSTLLPFRILLMRSVDRRVTRYSDYYLSEFF